MTAFAGLSRPHLSALLRPMPTSVNPLAMQRTSRTLFTQPQRTVSVRRMGQRRIDPTEQGAASGEAKKDSLWQSWLNLDPSTRLAFGITLAVIAVGGMKVSDTLRQKLPTEGTAAEGGVKSKGKLLGFSVVDRKDAK